MKNIAIMLIAVSSMLWAGPGAGRELYVSLDGTNNAPYTNWADAATNIAWAVAEAEQNDTIWISNATYVLTNYIEINEDLAICGIYGKPVIDGNNQSRCFYIALANTATLSNLFFTRGSSSGDGGAVYMTYGQALDCVFSNNTANLYGGALCVKDGLATVSRCLFIANNTTSTAAGVGSALHYNGSSGLVANCTFLTNNGKFAGGFYALQCNDLVVTGCHMIGNGGTGARLRRGARNLFTHCTVASNSYMGINAEEGEWVITNCYVHNNFYTDGGAGIRLGQNCSVRNCIIARNVQTNMGTTGGGASIS